MEQQQGAFEGWAIVAFEELSRFHGIHCGLCAGGLPCGTEVLIRQWNQIRYPSDKRPLLGFEGRYDISESGVITNVKTGSIRKWVFRGGPADYPSVQLWRDNRPFNILVHIAVANAFLPQRPSSDHIVNHKDGRKNNPHHTNLEWATWSENMEHAWRTGLRTTGRIVHGEAHHNCSLSTEQVKSLRTLRESGASYPELGRLFDINHSTARRICLGQARRNG